MEDMIKHLRNVQRTEQPPGSNKEWVLCDKCEKWRKVPRGFQFDRSKDFYCEMLPKMTCDSKEEAWEQDDQDASFITEEWVLFTWDRAKKELAREKNKFDAVCFRVSGLAGEEHGSPLIWGDGSLWSNRVLLKRVTVGVHGSISRVCSSRATCVCMQQSNTRVHAAKPHGSACSSATRVCMQQSHTCVAREPRVHGFLFRQEA
jgi:hypothetical protein